MGFSLKKLLTPHKAIRKLAKPLSKLAPLAAFIPGVGPIAAAAISAGSKYLAKGPKVNLLRDIALPGAGAAAGSMFAGSKLGGGALSKLGGLARGAGKTLGKTFTTPEGGVDVQRLLSLGGAAGSFLGQRADARAANRRNTALDSQRQAMMDKLLNRPEITF